MKEHGVECSWLLVFDVTLELLLQVLEHRLNGVPVRVSHGALHGGTRTVGTGGQLAVPQDVAVYLATLLVKNI